MKLASYGFLFDSQDQMAGAWQHARISWKAGGTAGATKSQGLKMRKTRHVNFNLSAAEAAQMKKKTPDASMDASTETMFTKMFGAMPDSAELMDDHGRQFTLRWSLNQCGFGEYHFYAGDDGVLRIANECMDRNSIKNVLGIFLDTAPREHVKRVLEFLVECATLDDVPFSERQKPE